ncbi:major intrinsically disordered NOTCH2-binding receptor 1-like [Etheostoma cragini]|uniref:major intrinsically disordered NOTCH2-binding receptor 1-like n=1 Tax=Etheostoma cragini TaxID=417921 RepID=UPI00155F4898|nr:major intrinsically disordered NOTCH2-binding receptor 1-like [Etheostoma cragini]
MDISVLPNNNHPEKFLQLDVGMLPATHGMFQVGALVSSQRHWQNRVYSQVWSSLSSLRVFSPCIWFLPNDSSPQGRYSIRDHHDDLELCGEQENRTREQRVKTESWSPPSPEGPRVVFEDRYLERHITPLTLKSNVKRNPLYMDTRAMEAADHNKTKPSWTVKEYDTQTVHGNLAGYLKVNPRDLDFWLEDLYTPGFDSLLKKKEAEHKRRRLCKILFAILVSVSAVLIVIVVPVVVLHKNN